MFEKKYLLVLSSIFILSFFDACGIEPENSTNELIVVDHVDSKIRSNKIEFSYDDDNEFSQINFIQSPDRRLKVGKSSEYLYIIFDHMLDSPNIQFFIDIDNDISTGYKKERGVEFVIENGILYISKNDNIWNWKKYEGEYGDIRINTKLGYFDAVRMDINFFKKNGKIRTFAVNAQALNKNWIPDIYSPSKPNKLIVK